MSRPSFQFYHGDWFTNAKLRFCTKDEKGHWIDIMCVMADADEFGILRRSLRDICEAVGGKLSSVRSLVEKGVLKGAEKGQRCAPFIYTPRSGRRQGPPVTLIDEQDGPIWYSSKMVRDDYIAKVRAEHARTKGGFGDSPEPSPNPPFGEAPIPQQSAVPPTPSPSPPSGKSNAMSGKPDAPPLNGQKASAVEVLDFLNAKTGRHYQPVEANLKLISARLKEGATVDDCRAVIAKKFRDWNADDKMSAYLRPATLFNATKFAQYRGELADG